MRWIFNGDWRSKFTRGAVEIKATDHFGATQTGESKIYLIRYMKKLNETRVYLQHEQESVSYDFPPDTVTLDK